MIPSIQQLLIVDDNPADRNLVADLLDGSAVEYVITEAATLREARRCLAGAEGPFDVVLIDVRLPDGSGVDLIPELQGLLEPPAILVLSGLAEEREAIDVVRAGAYDYLRKDDLGPELLGRTLRAAGEHARSRRQLARERQALARSEARFRAFAQTLPEPSWASDGHGVPQLVNTKWEEHFGPMRPWIDLVDEPVREAVARDWEQARRTRSPLEQHIPMLCRHGVHVHLVRAQPASAPATEWYVAFSDVQDLETARAQIERIAKGKDDFMAVLGHELRTPLASLRLAVEGIERDPSLREAMLPRAKRQLAVMERICGDLLDASRCMQGKVSLMLTPTDVSAVVHDASTGARPQFEARDMKLHVDVGGRIEIVADGVRLTQVVANLLSNAAKYGREGGNAWVRLERRPGGARLQVSDDGPGIDPELSPVLFEPFTQASRDQGPAKGGLGLGLSIAHRLVLLHGGTIRASDRDGGGAQMTVDLPEHVQPPAS